MNAMKYRLFLIVSIFSLLAGACTGKKAANTTPGEEAKPGETGKVEPAPIKDAAPAGPASDLCTEAQCPGVVR